MTYGQVRDQVLKLLNQYSVAGTKVDASYNNQQDYLLRIPSLVNDAMVEIATTARKIPATLRLADLPQEDLGRMVRFELPQNFYQFISGSVVKTMEGIVLHTNHYAVQGHKFLLVPAEEVEDYSLTYYRYPNLLTERPDDLDELDNEPETHYAVACYVAAYLADYDDAALGALLHNAYEDKLMKMSAGLSAEVHPVADAYGFFGGGGAICE